MAANIFFFLKPHRWSISIDSCWTLSGCKSAKSHWVKYYEKWIITNIKNTSSRKNSCTCNWKFYVKISISTFTAFLNLLCLWRNCCARAISWKSFLVSWNFSLINALSGWLSNSSFSGFISTYLFAKNTFFNPWQVLYFFHF